MLKRILELKSPDSKPMGEGPWNNEPDKIQYLDEETGYDCLIVRGPVGALCGYVGVPERHPLFGKAYWDDDFPGLQAHGGITFTNKCQEDHEHGICHVSDNEVWWIGFDCGHYGDLCPSMYSLSSFDILGQGIYRDVDYVERKIMDLAKQLKELEV